MRKTFIFLMLLIATQVHAQGPTVPPAGTEITKAIPPSPDAAALGKFGRTPVGYFTGVPNISIPIYTIKSGDLTLPVSINYHAGGIKVEEQASSVGLGWALNAGGAITRTVRGNVDESTFGYLDAADYVGAVSNSSNGQIPISAQAGSIMNKMANGTYDGEADIFNFNFGGYSGQFSFSHTSGIIISPQQNIAFTYVYTPGQRIPSFTAKTPDGVTWYFGSPGGVDAVEYAQRDANTANQKSYNTSWLLKSIISPTGSRIDFTYKAEAYSQSQPGGTRYRLTSGSGVDENGSFLRTDDDYRSFSTGMHNMKLTGITFENGNLQVFANLKRLDLSTLDPALQPKMIDTIAVSSTGFMKVYKFYYTNKISSRLRLDSLVGQLEPVAGTTNYRKEKYSFTYNPDIATGGTMAYNQDWWGYYNGANQTTLVPTSPDPLSSTPLPGANRTPDAGYMTVGMLTSIKYPTNGYTNFFFEPNQTPDYDFGADGYVSDTQVTAFSNDNQSLYYNYDNRNDNPTHLMHVYNQNNPVTKMAVHLAAYGMRDGNNPPPPLYDLVTARIYGQDNQGNYTDNIYSITNTDTTIYLNQGYYAIALLDNKRQTDTTRANYVKYSIAATWANHLSLPGQSQYVGHTASGLRIARIEDYDGINSKPFNVRSYTYNLTPNRSSGFLNYQPAYSYDLTVLSGNYQQTYTHTYLVRTASSNYPMATQSGAVVGYYSVQEYFDKNGVKGKEEYNYDISGQGINGSGFPFAPPTQQDWHNGLLLNQVTSKNIGSGQFQPVRKKVNVYNVINFKSEYNSIKTGFNPYPIAYDETTNYYPTQLRAQSYPTVTDYKYLASDTTYIYDLNDATKSVKTWNNYTMDPVTYQLTKLQSINSKNELITQSITYPNTASPSIRGVNYLNAAHIFTYPIEEVTQKSDLYGGNSRTVKAVLTTYKSTKPFRDTVFVMRSAAPVTNFASAVGGAVRDSRYQPEVAFNKYDAAGNILQERKINDALRSYIWGYKDVNPPYYNTYPIAEVLNADSASIAYTNFESYNSTGLGNWVYNSAGTVADVSAPMGQWCYTVSSSNTLVKNGLTASATYILSFWSKTGAAVTATGGTVTGGPSGNAKSGWTYREYTLTGATSVTIGGTGLIDELRLYPADAQMSTYTYTPLVGLTSKCDVRNNITYFAYDIVGRLVTVFDQNRNILKDYKYNYAVTDPIWVDVSPLNVQCVKDPNGNNTGEQQRYQKDSNPSSPTYQQTRWLSLGTNTTSCPIPPPPILYVKMTLASTYTSGIDTYNTYQFNVYSDAACTTSYNVLANLTVNYNVTITTRTNGTVTNTLVCPRTIVIPAGTNIALSDAIDVTACITCAGGGGGGGGGEALVAKGGTQQSATAGGAQTNVGGGGGTGTSCSSTVALTTGSGYTPKY